MAAGTSKHGTIHVNAPLTNVSIGYTNQLFIADKVLPKVPVAKEKDSYFTFGRENFLLSNTRRADGAPSNAVTTWTASTSDYACETHSLRDLVTDRLRANADAPLQPDITTTKKVTEKILLRLEYEVASYLFNATTFSGYTAAAGTQWSDFVNSDPISDVDTAKSNVQKQIGRSANAIVLGQEVYDKLKRHPDLIDIVKYTQKGVLTPQMIGEALGLSKVIIGGAPYNTDVEGGTESMSYLWGKFALIGYITDSPAIDEPSLGYIFNWKLYGNGTAKVKKWRDEERDGDWIEVTKSFDPIVTAARAGYLYSSVVA